MAQGGRRVGGGRKPIPVALQLIRGNPGKRRLKKPPPDVPSDGTCPAWLDAEGRAFWELRAPGLIRIGLLTATSEAAFAVLCDCWSTIMATTAALRTGLTHETPNNGASPKPEIGIKKTAVAEFRALCTEFGMTPAALTRLGATDTQPKKGRSKWEGLLS